MYFILTNRKKYVMIKNLTTVKEVFTEGTAYSIKKQEVGNLQGKMVDKENVKLANKNLNHYC